MRQPVRQSRANGAAAAGVVCVVAGLFLLALSGCAALHPLDGLPARYLPDEYRAPRRSGRKTIDLSLLAQRPPAEYRVDSGDVLGIYIPNLLGRADQAPPVRFPQRDEEASPSMGYPIPVRDDGTISLPLVGALYVRGMTLRQIEERIFQALVEDRRILNRETAHVFVSLQKPRVYRVLVIRQEGGTEGLVTGSDGQLNLGALKRGTGRVVALPAYRNDVLHALALTGGLPGLDAENTIYVIRNGRCRRPKAAPATAADGSGNRNTSPPASSSRQRSDTHTTPRGGTPVFPPEPTRQSSGPGHDAQPPHPQSTPELRPVPDPAPGPQQPVAPTGAWQWAWPQRARSYQPYRSYRSPGSTRWSVQVRGQSPDGRWQWWRPQSSNRPRGSRGPTALSAFQQTVPQTVPSQGPHFPPPPGGTSVSPPGGSGSAPGCCEVEVGAGPGAVGWNTGQPGSSAVSSWSGGAWSVGRPQPVDPFAAAGVGSGNVPSASSWPPSSPVASWPPGQPASTGASGYGWVGAAESGQRPVAPSVGPAVVEGPRGPSAGLKPYGWPDNTGWYEVSLQDPPAGFEWVGDPTIENPRVIRIPVRLAPGEQVHFTEQDVILGDGDIVFIESRDTEVFYTGGLLGGGQYTLPRDYDLDVLGAISIAQGNSNQQTGGGTYRALGGPSALNQDVSVSASQVIILRQLPDGTQLPIKVNLYKAMRDPAERVLIQPGDYIILQYTPVEAIAAFFERYILEAAIFGAAAGQINN